MITRICRGNFRRSFGVKLKSSPKSVVPTVVADVTEPPRDPYAHVRKYISPPEEEPEPEKNFWELQWEYSRIIFPICLLLFGLKYFFCVPIIGRSMSPQFNPNCADHGDTVIFLPRFLDMLREKPLIRGEIYLFTDPSGRKIQEGDTDYIIKRCIAVEGDTVMIQKNEQIEYVEIPQGHCWLESDNYTFQAGQYPDSLKFGPIANSSVWGRVVWCYRRNNIFPTDVPLPQNYEFYVPVERALPHQRVMFSRNMINKEFKALADAKNLPNKEGMDLLPKGPTDKAFENMTPEEKQGWSYAHDFTLSSDIKFIQNLEKKNKDALEMEEVKRNVPGASITRKPEKAE